MGQIEQKLSILIPFFIIDEIKNLFYKIEQDLNITHFTHKSEISIVFYTIKIIICGEKDTVEKYVKEIKQFDFVEQKLIGDLNVI